MPASPAPTTNVSTLTAHDPRLAAWATFLRAHARVTRALERELHDEQRMALADYDVLVQLAAATPHQLRMGELADRLLLSRSGITRLIDRLERAGFVTRATCDTDRRGSWAVLTDAGYARLREATPSHLRGVAEHFIDRIPSDELAALEETLARVLD
ncbi:MAG TPA: MarR family transcriptional regulator [Candidatus Limnocylindria bacterium]|nr:MarR family transcriptional regulator [Candidatus Limnocylindria bacterium]